MKKPKPTYEELLEALKSLLEWESAAGGWDDPIWNKVAKLVKRAGRKDMTYQDVVKEFIEDVKLAYGTGKCDDIDVAALCWTDLAITYLNALAVRARGEDTCG